MAMSRKRRERARGRTLSDGRGRAGSGWMGSDGKRERAERDETPQTEPDDALGRVVASGEVAERRQASDVYDAPEKEEARGEEKNAERGVTNKE
jgi:hypothetical protein